MANDIFPPEEDAELSAMQSIVAQLSKLDADGQRRVLEYAAKRFGGAIILKREESQTSTAAKEQSPSGNQFNHVSELIEAAGADTDSIRALCVAYWFAKQNGHPEFQSQDVNNELKHMGHPASNITKSLTTLINHKPQLVRQVRKDGKAAQARKKYAISLAGVKYIDEKLGG